ncbi:uncharacterized protein LOC122642289 [Telopea speciosissima]|uniref:uncharacterized protein LOC122642289 n=1 Tax=Telopea speciosissima TaxID=54955 RepID=UPI001CC51574|nr:uncharacterized protein LOC122642289 [Telopea speciosissima]
MGVVAQNLDLILVPSGLLIMFTYDLYLLYRVLKYPSTTAIGYENRNWMAWVERMMQGDLSYVSLAISVLSNSITGSIYLASFCLSFFAFIGVWVGSSSSNAVNVVFILGNTTQANISLKNISMLVTFMLAFGAFIQSVRYFVQANSLISMPNKDVPVSYVQRLVLRGNNFWQVGLRVVYFAMAFLFWSFGPIPMFASCVVMVICLYFLDTNKEPLHLFRPLVEPPLTKVVQEVVAVARA